jgi:hypothetical protein
MATQGTGSFEECLRDKLTKDDPGCDSRHRHVSTRLYTTKGLPYFEKKHNPVKHIPYGFNLLIACTFATMSVQRVQYFALSFLPWQRKGTGAVCVKSICDCQPKGGGG